MDDIIARANALSLASLVFGILAVLGSFVIVPTPMLSGLAITFSWLSRGDKRMNSQALAGSILAAIAIVISLIVFGVIMAACVAAGRQGVSFFEAWH